MKKNQTLYLDFAEQACALERENQWLQASEHWKQATVCPTKTANRNWAESRAQYCAVRAGIYFQTTFTQGEIVNE